jgi:hypothetical protein
MRRRVALAAVVGLSALSARAASTERALGFHPGGEVAYVAVDDDALGKLVRVCRVHTDALPDAWPPALTIAEGAACAILTDEAAGAPAASFATNAVAGAKPTKVTPWGVQLSVVTVDGKQVLKASSGKDIDGGTTIDVRSIEGAPLKIVEQLWRADGGAVAVTLEPTVKGAGNRVVVVADLSSLLVGGPAGKKLAQAKVKEAEALLKKRQWQDAGRALDAAIVADPGLASAHYQRAATDAQSGIGLTSMVENLTWLKNNADKDPAAKKLLETAAKDRAFDAWVGEPEVRALLGLEAVASMTIEARLLERTATWTRQGATCKAPWLTLTFSKGGKGLLEVAESCKGKKSRQKQPFTWVAKEATATLTTAAKDVGDMKIPATGLLELDGTYQQLRINADGVDTIGPFEPGMAHVDDSV